MPRAFNVFQGAVFGLHRVRKSLTLVAAVAAALLAVAQPLGVTLRAEAHPTQAPPPPQAFALPASTFPRWMSVRGSPSTNAAATVMSGLHTDSLAQLGRVEGYLEAARWSPATRNHPTPQPVTLQYGASLFGTADAANSAYADARASLWEIGQVVPGRVANEPTFGVTERDGHGDAYLLLHDGPIEAELRLRYDRNTPSRAVQTGLWYLRHAAQAARSLAHRLAAAIPPPSAPTSNGTLPPIFSAPWGTGPVVKSPSLMVLDTSQVSSSTLLDSGAFRSPASPSLAARAVRHAALVPSNGLSRYVRTALVRGGGAWYDEAALYGSAQLAGVAFSRLVATNRSRSWLQPYRLDPGTWHAGGLATLDDARAWKEGGEKVFAYRLQNVLMVMAEVGQSTGAMASLAGQLVRTVPTWLHAQGTDIVDATGTPVHLAGLNWYGAEEPDFIVGGLDYKPYQTILETMKRLGYNTIRVPFSNQMVEQNPVITAHVGANPELQGLHALDVLDRVVNYAGALGMSVILDDHRSDAGWSAQESGLWYTPAYPDAAFAHDWVTLAQRYAVNDVVVGADLRNEPHGPTTWASNDPATDWLAAAERAGDAVLATNPHLLIIVEGIETYGKSTPYWWGGSLMGVATNPVVLQFADGSSARSQLVYSAHDYGPDNCGTGCPWFNSTTTFQSLAQIWEQYWGYITDDPTKPYAAPVWVGEFGTCNYNQKCVQDTTPGSQGQWFGSLVQYIAQKHLNWAYWTANGTESTAPPRTYGTQDWYGLLDPTWSTPYPYLDSALQSIQSE